VKIATSDLKKFLYLVKSDEDLDLLVKALHRLEQQRTPFNFAFDAHLMRLMYVLDKTDTALELFMSKVIPVAWFVSNFAHGHGTFFI
jgi:hypothetical protein